MGSLSIPTFLRPQNLFLFCKNVHLIHLIILIFFPLALSCSEKPTDPVPEEKIICEAPEEWTSLGLKDETVTAIAVDPVLPNVIYVGTASDFSAQKNGSIFKSTDCGYTWDTILVGGSFKKIVIHPVNTNTIYALPGPIIKSEDAGVTWKNISSGIKLDWETRLQSFAIDPKNTDIVYAGTGGVFGGTMYKSIDSGLHWEEIGNDSLLDGVISIAIDPNNSNNVFAGTAWRGILWKSTDAGNSWFQTGLYTSWLIHDIFIDPNQSSNIFVAANGLYQSQNGGLEWDKLYKGLPSTQVTKVGGYSSRIFCVANSGDNGGLYEYSNSQNQWVRIGVDSLQVSYNHSALAFSSKADLIFFGAKNGIFVKSLK